MRKGSLCLVLIWGLLVLNGAAFGDDDFSGNRIDSTQWRQSEYAVYVDSNSGVLKAVSQSHQEGELQRPSFRFTNPEDIAGVKCEANIQELSLERNSDGATAEVRVHGFFYSTKAVPSSHEGDVWASVTIGNRGNGLEAYWQVAEILNAEITDSNSMGEGTLVDPGTLKIATTYQLELVHDTVAQEFHFAIYDAVGDELGSATLPYSNRQNNAFDPYLSLSGITYHDSGFVDVEFDNVYTKAVPDDEYVLYDDGSRFDSAKWKDPQFNRTIEDGKLVSMVQSLGGYETNRTNFIDMANYIEAEVIVSGDSKIAPGDRGIARIDGYIYNDSVAPANQTGYRGNVFTAVSFQVRDDKLEAFCFVSKSLDDKEEQWEDIWSESFDRFSFQYDTPYTVSLHYTGEALIFSISDGSTTQTHTYNIPTPVYEPYNEFRSLRTRVYGDTTGGIMKATFDNVVTTSGSQNQSDGGSSSGGGGGCLLNSLLMLR